MAGIPKQGTQLVLFYGNVLFVKSSLNCRQAGGHFLELAQEFLGHWNLWATRSTSYSYLYDIGLIYNFYKWGLIMILGRTKTEN